MKLITDKKLPLITTGFILGLALYLNTPYPLTAILIALGGLAIASMLKHPYKNVLILIGTGILLGWGRISIADHHHKTLETWTQTPFTAWITEEKGSPSHKSFQLRTLRGLISLPQNEIPNGVHLEVGDTLTLTGALTKYPTPTNPGEPNRELLGLASNHHGRLKTIQILTHHHTPIHHLLVFIESIRNKIITINQTLVIDPYANLLISFVFGDKNITLPEEWIETFTRTGLTHLLVVSGAQVALLNLGFIALFTQLKIPLKLRFGFLAGINACFYMLCGGGVSILRAIFMSQMGLAASSLGRKTPALHRLLTSGLIILILTPFTILNIGFQLSFMATAALIWLSPYVDKGLPKKMPSWIKSSSAASIATFGLTTPILWFHFHQISLLSILANIIITPFSEIIVVSGFVGSILGLIHLSLAAPVLMASGLLLNGLGQATTALNYLHIPIITLPHPTLMTLGILYTSILAAVLVQWQILIVIPTLIGTIITITLWPRDFTEIVILDIGQGDSAVIITPNHKVIMIDTGDHKPPYLDAGKDIILPFLRWRGIAKIDALILTHSDQDHIGGSEWLIGHIPIGIIFHNGFLEKQVPWLAKIIHESKIPSQKLISPEKISLGPQLYIQILHPDSTCTDSDKKNNQSIVTKIITGHTSFLFTGDLEAEKEHHLCQVPINLQATVLKLGHHGSKTSTTEEFLEKVSPQLALISVGRKNKFRHPAPITLRTINRHHIPILRTDQNGAITLISDGKTIKMETFIPANSLLR